MHSKQNLEVLKQLDEQANPMKMNFPAFGAGAYYVDSRLSVYADKMHWGILIETIEVLAGDIGHRRGYNTVYHYGNYPCRPIERNENRDYLLTSDGDNGSVFIDGELNPKVQTMKVRDHLVSVPHDPKLYERKGMLLVSQEKLIPSEYNQAYSNNIKLVNKDAIQPDDVLRALTPEYRDYFFLSDQEKQTEFLYPIQKILQLEEWRHPIYDEGNILEPPSGCEAFQMIAKVIATCDPSHYKPTEKPNTHWSNWLIADRYI